MKISNITNNKIVSSKIVIDKPSIYLVFPDTNIDIWDYIYKTNFILNNCQGIISPGKISKFMNKSFNGRIQALEFKKQMLKIETSSKKLRVTSSLHTLGKKDEGDKKPRQGSSKYYFYDMSIYSKAIESFSNRSVKKLTEHLILACSNVYQEIKKNYPQYTVDMIFLMRDNEGFLGKMFDNIKTSLPQNKLKESTFYDNFCFVSPNNRYLLPILSRKDGENKYIIQHINKIPAYFIEDEVESEVNMIEPTSANADKEPTDDGVKEKIIDGSDSTQSEVDQKSPVNGIVKGLSKELKVTTNVGESGEVKVEVNTKQLKKILSAYDIDDPTILPNVKVAIDKYLTINRESKEKMTKEQAEILVLKAINKTIHGTDELRDAYKHDPKTLFDKLKNTKTYQVPLEFPEYENELVQPKHIVDLDYTSGQYRQKFEFSEAVHQTVEKLFRTLEDTKNYPIKIKNIKHETIDNDSDRLIQYTLTVQNVDGGDKKPYELKFNIPGLVSERYFKLRNSHYVMKNQQFMKPLTKTDPNEVRLLSNYAIVSVRLTNFKFNAASIEDFLNYIKIKYPKFIKKESEEEVTLFNGDRIGITNDIVYASADGSEIVKIDPDTNSLIDHAGSFIPNTTKYEFQLDYLFNRLKEINPKETLSKSKLKIPYLEIYLGGLRIPLILYLWSQKGLLTALNDESIDYKITDTEPDDKAKFVVRTNKNQYLNIYVNSFRQECFVNGLISVERYIKDKNINDLNKPESSHSLITEFTNSSGAIQMIALLTENEIDPITKDLLEFEGNSTNFVKIVSKDMIDMLFKRKPDNLADLSIYRARLSEMIFATLYKQLRMAHNNYRKKAFVLEDPDAKIEIYEDYITQQLITTVGVLQNTEPFNPVEEISLASRVIKSGKGGGLRHNIQ